MAITIKTPEEIQKMRVAGRLAAQVLKMIRPHVKAGVSTEELRATNGLKSNKVAAGTRLLVPTADRAGAGSATAADGVVYIVRGGDTLSSVARDHSVTRDDLASWNGIGRNDPLLPGQKLRIVASEGGQPRRGRSTS